jgi:hypothetical protein
MYELMRESQKGLASFRGKKLYRALDDAFLKKVNWTNIDSKREFSEPACIRWFQKKGNDYKNIGFKFKIENEEYIFELATEYIYFGKGNRHETINRKGGRYDDIFKIIKQVTKHPIY